jgi:hypothetical protein
MSGNSIVTTYRLYVPYRTWKRLPSGRTWIFRANYLIWSGRLINGKGAMTLTLTEIVFVHLRQEKVVKCLPMIRQS